jgi:3-methyladenine DNA glycosylase AlkD
MPKRDSGLSANLAASHKDLLTALHALAATRLLGLPASSTYIGSPHVVLGVTTPELRRLARLWLAANKSLSGQEILLIVDRLIASHVHDEKTLGALILGCANTARSATTTVRLNVWLDALVGWAEVDALCSNVFQPEDFLADWATYKPWLRRLSADANPNKRRASLVLLTGPVRRNDDPRLAQTALANLRDLQHERSILITKAISWLLRSLVALHRTAVISYLDSNRSALPAIAIREVSVKLQTGRKR